MFHFYWSLVKIIFHFEKLPDYSGAQQFHRQYSCGIDNALKFCQKNPRNHKAIVFIIAA